MPLLETRTFQEALLEVPKPKEGMHRWNHIFEPEYHQALYVDACVNASRGQDAFQLSKPDNLKCEPHRGLQPQYADIEDEPDTLEYEGMILSDGSVLSSDNGKRDVCALKSVSVRWGFIDFSTARSVSRDFYDGKKKKAGVVENDVLINSTGDGTIGRVAIYNRTFPAVVDGHITILRFKDSDLAWYVAAYLLSDEGQNQLYRYINGSSGQVELYPQDIGRVWVSKKPEKDMKRVVGEFRSACTKHDEFYVDLKASLSLL